MSVVKSILISLAVLLVGGGCGVIIGANVVDLDYSESEYIEYGEQQKQEGLNEGVLRRFRQRWKNLKRAYKTRLILGV